MKIPVYYEPTSEWRLEDDTFICMHEHYHIETVEVDTMVNGEHGTYDVPIIVCDDCEEDLELEPDYE